MPETMIKRGLTPDPEHVAVTNQKMEEFENERVNLIEKAVHFSNEKRKAILSTLESDMFGRLEDGEKFHPLTEDELAVLHYELQKYEESGQLTVFTNIEPELHKTVNNMRIKQLTGVEYPELYVKEGERLVNEALSRMHVSGVFRPQDARMMILWRAALIGARPGHMQGIRKFEHENTSRDEHTLETIVTDEAEELRDIMNERYVDEKEVHIIFDPMLATSGSMEDALMEKLNHAKEEKVVILCLFAAPEGLWHILKEYPNVEVFVVKVDTRLNSEGFIEPGVGDSGDLTFNSMTLEDKIEFHRQMLKLAIIKNLRVHDMLGERLGVQKQKALV